MIPLGDITWAGAPNNAFLSIAFAGFSHFYLKTTTQTPGQMTNITISAIAVDHKEVIFTVLYTSVEDGVLASCHVSKSIMVKHYPGELQKFWDIHGGRY
ncbi:hypothetical protein BHE90_002731 [Fusarium euwallaceae]|uniref:Uncharacterized protein n=1 Tax=Fusarium euwallaceae TaxID=1147111 RepID=A0A430M3Z1_9HYPO|nr:hypothetical protein BHE90_002731 [Fusarium euwallaceae]